MGFDKEKCQSLPIELSRVLRGGEEYDPLEEGRPGDAAYVSGVIWLAYEADIYSTKVSVTADNFSKCREEGKPWKECKPLGEKLLKLIETVDCTEFD